ncbi:MAG: glycosyltransferase family 4 protein [Solirubrobacterales bacterium]
MRIAYFCSAYPAISHTFILREVEALRRLGMKITTFAIRPTPQDQLLAAADREAAATTVTILPFRRRQLAAHLRLALRAPAVYLATLRRAFDLAPPGLRGRLWQLFYFLEAVVLWRECERRDIDHVHVHLANAAADVAMLAAEIGRAVRPGSDWGWSFTMHGPTEFYDVRHFRLPEKIGSARFVVCISDFARSQLMGFCEPETWERLHVVHVGIPIERFTPAAAAPASNGNGSENGNGHRPTVLYIGRLVPEKGQAVLLEAVAELARRGTDVELALAGEGRLRVELEAEAGRLGIAERVCFLGAVGQEELHRLYEDAAIFCLPSFAEGVPVVLMEAMAMGLPVVTTRIAGIPELIDDGSSGVLVAPGRPDQLADSLAELAADGELRRRLGAGGRDAVERGFDCEATAAQLYDVFARECR